VDTTRLGGVSDTCPRGSLIAIQAVKLDINSFVE
jgi:hypothetical protein